jgi:hypothetical protein
MQLQAWEFQGGLNVNKWSDVKCNDVEWNDMIYVKWFCFEVKWVGKWSEVSHGEVLEDKYIRLTVLHVVVCFVMWLYYCYVIFIIILCILIIMIVPFCVTVIVCSLCVNVYWTTTTGIRENFLTTLTEVSLCFFLICKANARVQLAKMKHGQHFPNSYFLLLCMFRSLYSVYCLCVNVYCTTATGCQPNCRHCNMRFWKRNMYVDKCCNSRKQECDSKRSWDDFEI